MQFGLSLPNQERNSFYKGFPLFQNLTELKLNSDSRIIHPDFYHDWGEVLAMLPYCPKLQTLQIKKVCF
jgi:hypothetical protein